MKIPVPPWLVRRLIIAPLMPVLALFALLALVVSLLLGLVWAAVLVLAHRRVQLRAARICAYAALYLLLETGCLLGCFVLWLRFPGRQSSLRAERSHLGLIRFFLGTLVRAAGPLFGFRLMLDPADEAAGDRLSDPAPIVVLARHAGPGASFVVIYLLVAVYRRQPRIVLKRELQLDPAIDILLTRLGSEFINPHDSGGEAGPEAIATVAGELHDGDAFVLFPEGANWTPERHRSALRRLRQRGLVEAAVRAADDPHVLPPRPAGTLTALNAAPRTDVMTVVHTGYDELVTAGLLWQAFPLPAPLTVTWWVTPSTALPDSDDDRQTWLLDQWDRVDSWVAGH